MKRRTFLHLATSGTVIATLNTVANGSTESKGVIEFSTSETSPVILQAIQFAYSEGQSSLSSGAEFIRQNEQQTFNSLDWELGREFSNPVVYRQNSQLSVKAKFKLTEPSDQIRYHIRAVYKDNPQKIALSEIDTLPSIRYGNDTPKVWNFYQWQDRPDNFQGVDVHQITLLWQYAQEQFDSEVALDWKDIITTNHKIFVILESVSGPWDRNKDQVNNPWIDVLEIACVWARGATTKEDAASKITKQIYSMGQTNNSFRPGKKVFGYDQGPSYTNDVIFVDRGEVKSPFFNLTKFLEHLKNKESGTIGGVCTDWATLVVTFSNILGCNLKLTRFEDIEGAGFTLNSCLLIGSDENDWRSRATASTKLSSFDNHVVAAQIADIPNQYLIYDACLAVDAKSSSSPPYSPLVATKMMFGPLNNPESYLHHLVDAKERGILHFFIHKAGKTYPSYFPITKL